MNPRKFAVVASLIVALIFAFAAPWQMQAQENKTPYPNMAPFDQYLMNRDAQQVAISLCDFACCLTEELAFIKPQSSIRSSTAIWRFPT